MKRKNIFRVTLAMAAAMVCLLTAACSDINAVGDPHFTADGEPCDSARTDSLTPAPPDRIHFYVEVSGSMNGFFRGGVATQFKTDVWRIMSYYAARADSVTILTAGGTAGMSLTLGEFRTLMNAGAFVSTASTDLPEMLASLYKGLDSKNGEVAVMISDMRYDPVGNSSPDVLRKQYATDIGETIGRGQLPLSLIGATSDYAGRTAEAVCEHTPYYYVVIGGAEQAVSVRNGISAMLEREGRLIDNIECGFRYGPVKHAFGKPGNCWQMDKASPTFCGYEPSANDTCTIRLNIELENYRWLVADTAHINGALRVRTLYGSKVAATCTGVSIDNFADKKLRRRATATVEIRLWAMPMDADVVEWSLELPDTDVTLFAPYLSGDDPNDVTKTYSLEQFIEGMFFAGQPNGKPEPNHILISKNS